MGQCSATIRPARGWANNSPGAKSLVPVFEQSLLDVLSADQEAVPRRGFKVFVQNGWRVFEVPCSGLV